MAIPKRIHLCWFGNQTPDRKIRYCLNTIKSLEKYGYEVKIWSESNYNIGKSEALRKAYDAKKWSLVSNYARVDILNEFGGIYLDTDVQVVRNFDDLLENKFFCGFIWDCLIGTAVIGSVPGHPIVKGILERYDSDSGYLISPNNNTFTDYFIHHVVGFALDGRNQTLDEVCIFDKYTFEHPTLFNRSNYTVHHFAQSWRPGSRSKRLTKTLTIHLVSLWLYRKYICLRSKWISPYYATYLKQKSLPQIRSN